MVILFVALGADVNLKDNNGMTPLHIALSNGDLDIIKLLIDNDADINIKNNIGVAPLHLIFIKDYIEIVKLIIKKNIFIDMSLKVSNLNQCKEYSNYKTKYLYYDILIKTNYRFKITNLKNVGNVVAHSEPPYILISDNFPIHSEVNGKTPLELAIKQESLNLIELYISNTENYEEKVILPNTSESKNIELIKRPNINEKYGLGKTLLHHASKSSNIDILKLLLDKGASINEIDDEGKTVLHYASKSENINIIKLLLDKGANSNLKCYFLGDTPLHIACYWGQVKNVKILIEYGADIEAVTIEEETPLSVILSRSIIWKEYLEVIKLLIINKANPYSKTRSNKTSLDLAIENNHTKAIKLLTEYMKNNPESSFPQHQR